MSNHRDHIARLIDDLLDTQDKRTLMGTALVAIGAVSDETYIQVRAHREELAYAQMHQEQALLDAVTTDAEHAARWRELVEQLDLDLDDTEVPHVFDAFEQDNQKGDGEAEEHAESAPALTVADLEAAPVGSVLEASHGSHWTKTSDDEWTFTGHSPSSVYTLSSRELCLSDGTLLKSWTLTLPAPQSPPDPQEHPLIRIHAFKGEELDEPIDAAWHDEVFVSFRGGSFPDKSNAAFLREVTRWTPLEAREVSGDE